MGQVEILITFLRATAGTAIARLSQ